MRAARFAATVRNVRANVDNVAKPVLDALKGIVYDDDKQVRFRPRRCAPPKRSHRVAREAERDPSTRAR